MTKPENKAAFGLTSRIHYAWIVIAIAAFMHMAGGSIRQAFGVLIVPLQEDMGWNPATVTLAYALASIVGALLAVGASGNHKLLAILGFCAIVFGTINVVGGYLVTDRMLKMFKKKGSK